MSQIHGITTSCDKCGNVKEDQPGDSMWGYLPRFWTGVEVKTAGVGTAETTKLHLCPNCVDDVFSWVKTWRTIVEKQRA